MSALMDIALDEIISRRGRSRGRGRGRGRGGGGSGGGVLRRFRSSTITRSNTAPYTRTRETQELAALDDESEDMWQHDLYDEEEEMGEGEEDYYEEEPQNGVVGYETGTKVRVENLEYSVDEENLKALFEKIGPVKSVRVFYDRSGRSKGQAEVTFMRRADGINAQRKFNGIQVDGKQISVSLVGTNVPIMYRGAARGVSRGRGRIRNQVVISTRGNRSYTRRIRGAGAGAMRVSRGRGAFRARGRGRKSFGPSVTADQLDAEMEEYNSSRI